MKLIKFKKCLIWTGIKTTIELRRTWMIGVAIECFISFEYKALVLILPFVSLTIENYNEDKKNEKKET